MLQHRQPLASSRNSSDVVGGRLEEVVEGLEMVIDFARGEVRDEDGWEVE